MGDSTVFVGKNTLMINVQTLRKLLESWLNEHTSGGPYRVLEACDDLEGFKVTFEAAVAVEGGAP